jgi:REP element-mobilizing transposase RayT
MVLAHHITFGMYGFWLPNDPRGSGSTRVGSWDLRRYGTATKTNSRRSVAGKPHDLNARRAAKKLLKYPPVRITGRQALEISKGFALASEEANVTIHACAIMPDHVHLVIGRTSRDIEKVRTHMKSRATKSLRQSGLWHEDQRPVWGRRGWVVFLDREAEVKRAIQYVENNPIKEGLKRQQWPFVEEYRR